MGGHRGPESQYQWRRPFLKGRVDVGSGPSKRDKGVGTGGRPQRHLKVKVVSVQSCCQFSSLNLSKTTDFRSR